MKQRKLWAAGIVIALVLGVLGFFFWQKAASANQLFDKAFLKDVCGSHKCKDLKEANVYMGARLHDARQAQLVTLVLWCGAIALLITAGVVLALEQRKKSLDQ